LWLGLKQAKDRESIVDCSPVPGHQIRDWLR
jgi:hypothetical protein